MTAAALAATAGARPAGFSVPQIRLVTLRPRGGAGLHALAVRLRADPRVARVEVEHRARLRFEPNDPALITPETAIGTAPGHDGRVVGGAQRLPGRVGRLAPAPGATVAVIDTGAETSHPELADRVLGAVELRRATAARRRPTPSGTAPTSPRWPAAPATTASASPARACAAGC